MASTELSLKRTLTDILEDELYHLNNKHSGVYSSHYQYPISNKAYMANQNDNINNNNGSNNNNEETVLTIEPEKLNFIPENENYTVSSNNNPTFSNKKDSSFQIHQPYEMSMFNKYADPSLTTTSTNIRSRNNSNNSGIQESINVLPKTVNMNNVLNIPNPFIQTKNNFEVKISNDTTESEELGDAYLYYDDDSFVPKIDYALEDNNMSLNNEDAKLIFDNEFSDDDDDEDEDDDEDNDFDDESNQYDIDDDEVISSLAIENNKNIFKKNNNIYRFVDTHNVKNTELLHDTDNNDIIENSDDLSEDALIDEDELYHSKNLNNTVVCNDEIRELNRSKSLSLKTRPNIKSMLPLKQSNKLRKPLTNINNNTSNSTTYKDTARKHKTYAGSDLSESNSNEIYTCRLINLITKEPCSAQFSRSYDLTRHQNTIHAKKKIIFRCSECIKLLGNEGYEKTFSRLDALTRHIKSKHENLTADERQRVTKYAKENIGYAAA